MFEIPQNNNNDIISQNNDDDILDNEYNDEQGDILLLNGIPFEVIGEFEYEGDTYYALCPLEDEEGNEIDEDEYSMFTILKGVKDGVGMTLSTVDDEALYEKLGDIYLELTNGIEG